MKTSKPNVIDTCLNLAGFKAKNNPGTVAGLFKEFQNYETQEFGEWQVMTCPVNKRPFADLRLQTIPRIMTHDGSAGESFYKDLYFVEFADSTLERVKPDYESGSNYAYSETVREAGETISECITRINKKIKRVVHIKWYYSSWDGQGTERGREIILYTF